MRSVRVDAVCFAASSADCNADMRLRVSADESMMDDVDGAAVDEDEDELVRFGVSMTIDVGILDIVFFPNADDGVINPDFIALILMRLSSSKPLLIDDNDSSNCSFSTWDSNIIARS